MKNCLIKDYLFCKEEKYNYICSMKLKTYITPYKTIQFTAIEELITKGIDDVKISHEIYCNILYVLKR